MLVDIVVIPYRTFKEKVHLTKQFKGYKVKDCGTYLECRKYEVENERSKIYHTW